MACAAVGRTRRLGWQTGRCIVNMRARALGRWIIGHNPLSCGSPRTSRRSRGLTAKSNARTGGDNNHSDASKSEISESRVALDVTRPKSVNPAVPISAIFSSIRFRPDAANKGTPRAHTRAERLAPEPPASRKPGPLLDRRAPPWPQTQPCEDAEREGSSDKSGNGHVVLSVTSKPNRPGKPPTPSPQQWAVIARSEPPGCCQSRDPAKACLRKDGEHPKDHPSYQPGVQPSQPDPNPSGVCPRPASRPTNGKATRAPQVSRCRRVIRMTARIGSRPVPQQTGDYQSDHQRRCAHLK